MLLSLLRVL